MRPFPFGRLHGFAAGAVLAAIWVGFWWLIVPLGAAGVLDGADGDDA